MSANIETTQVNGARAPMDRDSTPEVTFEVDAVEVPPLPRNAKDLEPMSVTSNLPPRAWPPRVVADLMTRKVITVQEDEPIGDLETWMDRFRFRHLPIVGADGTLVGLITRTDFLHAALGKGPDGKDIAKVTPETKASAIMRRGVVTAKPDAELTTALRVMLHEKLGCLPVINEDGTLVGIVTETDFARLTLEGLERAAVKG
jgi:CBS domain-containing protein